MADLYEVLLVDGATRWHAGWLVDDETDARSSGGPADAPLVGASTATTPAASSAVPNTRSPNSAYGSR